MDACSETGDTPIILGTSTKQPTGKQQKPSKRQKLESCKNELIEKVIHSLDRASQSTSHSIMAHRNDRFEVFGQYVTSELRSIPSSQMQHWAKLQIQTVLFNAQCSTATSINLTLPPYGHPMDIYHSRPSSSVPPLCTPSRLQTVSPSSSTEHLTQ